MDADKVIVLDHGLVVEEGHPHDMLVDENGKFSSMVNQTGEQQGGRWVVNSGKVEHLRKSLLSVVEPLGKECAP
jgi:hypothetical protein